MDMMSLQCFVALVDTERFTAAAELMFMSQPSFSRRIKELEAELGLLLVERSTRRIRITEAGKIVYRYACNILQEERRMRDELKIEDGKEKPSVTICYPSLMLNWISGLFTYLKEKLPGITVHYYLADGDAADIGNGLMEGRCDLMIFPEHSLNQLHDVQYLPLMKSPYCSVLSESSQLGKKENVEIEDLKELTILHFGTVGVQKMEHDIMLALRKNGCYPPRIEYVFNLDEMEFRIAMGNSYAILPSFLKDYSSKKLQFVPIKNFPLNGDRVCIWKSDNKNPVLKDVILEIGHWKEETSNRSAFMQKMK